MYRSELRRVPGPGARFGILSPPPRLLMLRTFRLFALGLATVAAPTAAQTQQVLFPGESGETLLASIRAAYRPSSTNGSNDDLYATVDRTTVDGQDGVVCVYTGLFVPFDGAPSRDPSQDVGNGFSNTGASINQEHTWPNSSLSGIAKSDLHNLFPTQVGVNADRGTLPFAEIDDARTTRWYRGAPPYTQTSPPADDIDAYSEIGGGAFEPREDHKGNVARALFYMAAVYDPPASNDFSFDADDRRTLYAWHYADAITEADQARSARVAAFQSGKDNPFVLDSTLARRAFFPEIVVVSTGEPLSGGPALQLDGPTPFRDRTRLVLSARASQVVRATLRDALGREVATLYDGPAPGPLSLDVDGRGLAPGVYTVHVRLDGVRLRQSVVRVR